MRGLIRAVVLCLALSIVASADDVTPSSTTTVIPPEDSSSDWGLGTVRDGFEAVNGYFDSFLEFLGGRNGVCQYKCRYGKAPLPRPDYKPPEPNGCSSYFLGLKVPESCTKCDIGCYICGTSLKLNERMNLHRYSINRHKENDYCTPIGYHFTQTGHSIHDRTIKILRGNFKNTQLDMGIPAMTKCCNQLDICYDTCGANKYRCDAKFRWCLHSICSDLKKSLGFVSKVEACESVADTVFNTVWTLGCKPFMNSQRACCICNEEEKDEL